MNHKIRNTPEFTPNFSLLAFLSGEIQSTKYYVRIYQRIMQNKPNFQNSQMNLSFYSTRDYENKRNWTLGQNKPKTNPISKTPK